MPRTLLIVETSQNRTFSAEAGLWFTIQGKFDEMAPLGLIDKPGTVSGQPVTISDAKVRNGVLSLKLDSPDSNKIPRGAKIELP